MSTTQEGKHRDRQEEGQGGEKADEGEDEQGDDRQGGPFAPSRLSSPSHNDTAGGVHPTHRPVPSLSR